MQTLGQYAFGYNEDHTSGGSFRRETGDRFGNKVGSYGLRIADGRIRIVNYVADHNGYRADVMTNEPGIENQNSNGYFAITKKGFRGVLIPGFRNSAEAPHVVYHRGNAEKHRGSLNNGNSNEPRSTFKTNIDEVYNDSNQANIQKPHSTFRKTIDEDPTNVYHGNINEPRSTFGKSIDEAPINVNKGNTNEPRSTSSKHLDETETSFNHGNTNEEHVSFNQGSINEPHNPYNRGNMDTAQNIIGKDHKEAPLSTFTQSSIGESVVAIPLENGLEDSNQVVEDAGFYAQANALTDVNEDNRAPDVSKDSHRQSYADELPDFLTESRATGAADISESM